MEIKIHFGLILFLISLSLFASSQAQAIIPLIPRDKSVDEKTLDVQEKILSLLEQMKEQNNEIIKQIVDVATNSTVFLEVIKDYFVPKNCDDLRQKGDEKSGIRTVYPYPNSPKKSIKVLCDQQTEDGGWTIFQARKNLPERENFYRNWEDYSHGFGDLNGEFWMGLESINVMSKLDVMELRVDLEDDTGEKRFAKYENFSVEDEDEKFKLNIGDYGGTAGDSLEKDHFRFTTKDQDNDPHPSVNCAEILKGAWWYYSCDNSNLNGLPHVGKYSSSHPDGIHWRKFGGSRNSMAKTKMMFRRSARINN